MRGISRRTFGRALIATVPIPWIAGAAPVSRASCPVGVTTSAFSDLPRVTGRDNVDDIIAALASVRAAHVELALQNVEPAPPRVAPVMGGSASYPRRIVPTPEEVAATNTEARDALRAWRLATPATLFEDVRERFARAGLRVHGCALAYNDSFTDEEIEATLRQVRALGLSTVSSPLTMAAARRLAPFAARHGVSVAIRNQVDGNRAGAVDTARLGDALALSPAFTVQLDIGSVTASNADAVAVLRRHLDRVSSVLVTDRLRNGGASQPFGEGDTPIKDVVAVLASAKPLPLFVAYDYTGLRSATDEVRASLAYVTRWAA